jgi:DNA-binding MarR family transcriptional regulator
MISILYRRSQVFFSRELECLGLGTSTYSPLLILYHHDGLSQEELAQRVGVDKAAMKRSVDSLVASGYVRREHDAEDGRAWKLRLTPKAQRLRPKVEAVLQAWEDLICAGLEEPAVDALRPVLGAMAANAMTIAPR